MSFPLRAADNCLPFSDSQTEAFTWFQIGSSIFANIFITSNFFAPWFFFRKHHKNIEEELQNQYDEIRRINQIRRQDIQEAQKLFDEVDRKLSKRKNR